MAVGTSSLRDLLLTTKDGDWGKDEAKPGFVPFRVIRGGDFDAVRFGDLSGIPRCYLDEKTVWRRTLQDKDILIETAGGTRDKPTGRSLLIKQRMLDRLDLPATCASFARFLRIDPLKAVPEYVYWFLQYMYETGEMWQHQVQHTGVARFQFSAFADSVEIPLPIEEQQHAIAHILGTLDDKIELNRRINETLEAIARTIFKSWFVDFDPVRAKAGGEPSESICRRLGLRPELLALFPDRFQESELGEVPEGWKISDVEKLSTKVGMGPFGSNIKVSTFVFEGIPVISGQHLNNTMLEDNTFNFISKEHADKLASANVTRGDVVFTHAGNIGQVAYIPDRSRYVRYVLSQRQFFMRCDISRISPIFMTYFFRSPEGQYKLLANTAQVGVPSIARPVSYLKSIELVVPPKPLSDQFDSLVRTFHQRISIERSETESLAKLRDTLLPKLISGELRVPEGVANERS